VSRPNPIRELLLCYVTDRKAWSASAEKTHERLLERIEAAGRAGVDWIQIREKDLAGRELAGVVEQALHRVPPTCRILVNDRLDVACALGAAGVHLGDRSLPVAEARRLARARSGQKDFLVGVSTHSLGAAEAAEKAGADYIIFGPIFPTPSKAGYGPSQGIERLEELCRSVSIPVLAIGGITQQNAEACLNAGAEGLAAIRLFQEANDLVGLVRDLRKV
jgi:thiamine-phosphate diphosphorylase